MAQAQPKCPHCESDKVSKFGTSSVGKQRYICRNKDCRKTFQDDYSRKGYEPRTRSEIYFLAVNGTGVRATARLLGISKSTVISALGNFEPAQWHVNHAYLESLAGKDIEIEIASETEAEMDEMWSFVQDKSQRHWLWWAIERGAGEPLAFRFGDQEHKHLDELLTLLKPFNVTKTRAGESPAYAPSEPGKRLSMRTWRARLVRKDIVFSKGSTD